jgi:hypothetical protein
LSDDLSIKYLRQIVEYMREALQAVVKSGELAAEHGDEFDAISIGRSAYDHAAAALRKIEKEEDVLG